MMFMNNMQNQSNSKDINIEEIIKPFKEKIRKLQDEILEKDSEIAQLKLKLMQYNNANKANNQFIYNNMSQMNNQMNPMYNDCNQMYMINYPSNMMMMNNQMNQMNNMGNQINAMENEILPRCQNQLTNNLKIKVKMEKGEEIVVQCRPDEKMKSVIKKFCLKACIDKSEDYDFIVIKEEEAKLDSSVEQNGIKQRNYILAKKKLDNNMESQSLNDKKETYFFKENPRISGEQILVNFDSSSGTKLSIPIGLNNTIKDAEILFCNKVDISYSEIGKTIIFLLNASELKYEDNRTLKQLGFRNGWTITVFDQGNVIGA